MASKWGLLVANLWLKCTFFNTQKYFISPVFSTAYAWNSQPAFRHSSRVAEEMSKPLGSTDLKSVKPPTGFCGFNSRLLRTREKLCETTIPYYSNSLMTWAWFL